MNGRIFPTQNYACVAQIFNSPLEATRKSALKYQHDFHIHFISWNFTIQQTTFFIDRNDFLKYLLSIGSYLKAVNCLHRLTLPFLWYSLFTYAGLVFVDFSSIFVLATQFSFRDFLFFSTDDNSTASLHCIRFYPIWHTYFRFTEYFNPPSKRTGLFIHFVCVLFCCCCWCSLPLFSFTNFCICLSMERIFAWTFFSLRFFTSTFNDVWVFFLLRPYMGFHIIGVE